MKTTDIIALILALSFFFSLMYSYGFNFYWFTKYFKNDWKIVDKVKSEYVEDYGSSKSKPFYVYLKYSKSRNKYKIESTVKINQFENDASYQKMLDKQIKLENV